MVAVEDWVGHEVRGTREVVRKTDLSAGRGAFQRRPRHAKALQLNVHFVSFFWGGERGKYIFSYTPCHPQQTGKKMGKWRNRSSRTMLDVEVRKDIYIYMCMYTKALGTIIIHAEAGAEKSVYERPRFFIERSKAPSTQSWKGTTILIGQ